MLTYLLYQVLSSKRQIDKIEQKLDVIEDKVDKIIGESDTIDITECLARACHLYFLTHL